MLKYYYENPNVNDQIIIDFYTPQKDTANMGCFNQDPYAITNIKIYFIARDINGDTSLQNISETFDIKLYKEYLNKYQQYCQEVNPTLKQEYYNDAEELRKQLVNTSVASSVYFTQSIVELNIGSITESLWVNGAPNTDSVVKKVSNTETIQYGHFEFTWKPNSSVREGDYYLCFTWQPNSLSTETYSDFVKFYLNSDVANTVATPSHIVSPDKYLKLLEAYTPEMYFTNYANDDVSVDTLNKLNKSIASGFNILENLGLQLQDIQDANATQEPLLVFLSNLFSLKLRTQDPTLWRRQIKTAMPKAKKKGTYEGLKQALSEANIRLVKLDQLWQCGTDFMFAESFQYLGINEFILSNISLPINTTYFEIEFRKKEDSYSASSLSNITITTSDGKSVMKWVGNPLVLGDHIKITYQILPFTNPSDVTIYNYIKTLPLADQRDDRYFDFPKKDWNTRLISEFDSMFGVIVAQKNPITGPTNFGKIRTIFPYSENVYNMDEYNGSLRDSQEPCDIDKNFIEPCRGTISSFFDIVVEIENYSSFRITEYYEILNEYIPLHANLNDHWISASLEDFFIPPEETIETFIVYNGNEFTIAGNAQIMLNRAVYYGPYPINMLRNNLASETVLDTGSTNAYNKIINLFSYGVNFQNIGISSNSSKTFLEITSGVYTGNYTVSNPNGFYIQVIESVAEPINLSNFSYKLSNIFIDDPSFTVTQANKYKLSDASFNYNKYNIKTLWDVSKGYATASYKVRISATDYDIEDVLDNVIYIKDNGSLSNISTYPLSYSILDSSSNIILTSTTGNYLVENYAKVTVNAGLGYTNITQVVNQDTYFYNNGTGIEYKFYSYDSSSNTSFYISGWNLGSGVYSGKILNRVATNTGSLSYYGMKIQKPAGWPVFDIPATTIVDTQNFKENYLVFIGTKPYYFVDDVVDGSGNLTIGGDLMTLKTTGTSLSYELRHYTKASVTSDGVTYKGVDRSGAALYYSDPTGLVIPFAMAGAEEEPTGGPQDQIKNTESISFKIEYSDGKTQEGDIT